MVKLLSNPISYSIETDLPLSYSRSLIDFIHKQFLSSPEQRVADVSKKDVEGDPSISFTTLDSMGRKEIGVEVRSGQPVKIQLSPLAASVSQDRIDEVRQNVAIAVDLFEDNVEKNTIFFAWREGEEIVPERLKGNENKPLNRIFLGTQILLAMVFIFVSIFLIQVLGWLTPVILLLIQLVFVVYSGKIVARAADWKITEKNPYIHLLEYHLPLEEQEAFRQKVTKEKLMQLKKDIYEQEISKKGEIDNETVHQIFLNHGFDCKPENLSAKKVNVYELVKRTTSKFGYKIPEIVVSNTTVPNASASGPSPSQGLVLITTGIFVHLNDDEIVTVLGHEFGHLKGRDPLLLYGLTAVQYLFFFYLFFYLVSASLFALFLYYWIVLTAIYFIAKFFEARADLISAMVIGEPQLLAGALEKIGFRRLLYERVPSFRVQEWLSFEPHPPVYFRVKRLEGFKTPIRIKSPMLQSIKDVTQGFLKSL